MTTVNLSAAATTKINTPQTNTNPTLENPARVLLEIPPPIPNALAERVLFTDGGSKVFVQWNQIGGGNDRLTLYNATTGAEIWSILRTSRADARYQAARNTDDFGGGAGQGGFNLLSVKYDNTGELFETQESFGFAFDAAGLSDDGSQLVVITNSGASVHTDNDGTADSTPSNIPPGEWVNMALSGDGDIVVGQRSSNNGISVYSVSGNSVLHTVSTANAGTSGYGRGAQKVALDTDGTRVMYVDTNTSSVHVLLDGGGGSYSEETAIADSGNQHMAVAITQDGSTACALMDTGSTEFARLIAWDTPFTLQSSSLVPRANNVRALRIKDSGDKIAWVNSDNWFTSNYPTNVVLFAHKPGTMGFRSLYQINPNQEVYAADIDYNCSKAVLSVFENGLGGRFVRIISIPNFA
jgi:hypothetical protein